MCNLLPNGAQIMRVAEGINSLHFATASLAAHALEGASRRSGLGSFVA
jgi:hypothetical protein